MNTPTFTEWFSTLTGHSSPRSWQKNLADAANCRDRLIRIPTGLGKTDGVLAAWSYHRLCLKDDRWPRRLIWCLPMRVLVEQTAEVAERMIERMPVTQRPKITIAMGGVDTEEWHLYPELPAILIGTQDMLLSRALNRGYASARARWPMEFGLLNQDSLWVMDEVQLMDVGLATSAQLQAFRCEDSTKQLRPCHTWWMSATLQPDWLNTVDTNTYHSQWIESPCTVPEDQQQGGLWDITKSASTVDIEEDNYREFAKKILEVHDEIIPGEYGKITLVVCNRVDRACETYAELKKQSDVSLYLVHSRFRPFERQNWRKDFLAKEHCNPGKNCIIVATQVVEAGVDISAGCLITELAPWPSLVQRFGRCARYGGSGKVVVVNCGITDKQAIPYEASELESAWETIQQLKDVGIKALENFENTLSDDSRKRLYPYEPSHLLLRSEFDELFDTTPDLTGADLDISRFIRTGDERDLQVFWLDIPADKKGEKLKVPPSDYAPTRQELCNVPFIAARQWLCGKDSKLQSGKRAWFWDWLDGEWKIVQSENLFPGRVICVAADAGGYDPNVGFDPKSKVVVNSSFVNKSSKSDLATQSDNQQDQEPLSFNDWKTIAFHTQEVLETLNQILSSLQFKDDLYEILQLAATFHDWGKSHPAFQGSIRDNGSEKRLQREDIAKAPQHFWSREHLYQIHNSIERRPAFRHELASALGIIELLYHFSPTHDALLGQWMEVLQQLGKDIPTIVSDMPDSSLLNRLIQLNGSSINLLLYLVASHHGKVRVGLHAAPKDQDYRDMDGNGLPIRGVRNGDVLPSVQLLPNEAKLPQVTLSLSIAEMGLSERTGISWRERTSEVLKSFGPCSLGFLEALIRAADIRASQSLVKDPALSSGVSS